MGFWVSRKIFRSFWKRFDYQEKYLETVDGDLSAPKNIRKLLVGLSVSRKIFGSFQLGFVFSEKISGTLSFQKNIRKDLKVI